MVRNRDHVLHESHGISEHVVVDSLQYIAAGGPVRAGVSDGIGIVDVPVSVSDRGLEFAFELETVRNGSNVVHGGLRSNGLD
jgi:hypothetical protein